MATQAEINKLWAEQLAQGGGTTETANTLRKQALAMGITPEQLNTAESNAFNAQTANNPTSYARTSANLGMGGTAASPMSVTPTGPTANSYWNGGQAANAEQLATAQNWAKGKTSEELAAKGKEMNLSPEQFGSVFGQSGAAATGVGYGTAGGLNDSAKGLTWNGSSWDKAAPTTGGNGGGGGAPAAPAPANTAANTNIAGQYQSMGMSDPSGANARLLSGQVNNPYLDQQADNITKRLNRNLQENVLPGIGQGAQMAGQYGGSRQGIAQGKAIGDSQDNLANALTNMYSGANEAAQGRMAQAAGNLSGIGAQVGISNTQGQNSYNLGLMNNATQNKGIDNAMTLGQGNLALGNRNSDQQYALGQQSNATQNRSIDNAYTLGQGNLALGNRQADNQYSLGMQSNATQNRSIDNQYTLGQGNLALGNRNSDQQYSLGQASNATQNRSVDNAYSLGQGNLANQSQANQNSYNLGLANNNLGYANLDQSNQQFGANYGLNSMNAQTNWAQTQANIATQMQNTPINNFNNFNNNATGIAGQGQSETKVNPGNPYIGAIGGYGMAADALKNNKFF